jgi:hypothetical protein
MKDYISLLTIFLGIYIILLHNIIPKNFINLFNNDIFKIIILLIIVSISNKYKTISILLSIIFILTIINSKKSKNNYNIKK